MATCYLLGVSTRRMDKLVQTLRITGLSKSQVSDMAAELDAHVEEFRPRSLTEAGHFTSIAADALVLKVREGGRVVGVHALVRGCPRRRRIRRRRRVCFELYYLYPDWRPDLRSPGGLPSARFEFRLSSAS